MWKDTYGKKNLNNPAIFEVIPLKVNFCFSDQLLIYSKDINMVKVGING